jgi:ribonucleoside-diphosphate reductase alpha chain
MRVYDPAWIGMKLRKLLNYGEPNGSFMARTPGSDKSQSYPSTIAYLAQLNDSPLRDARHPDRTGLPGRACRHSRRAAAEQSYSAAQAVPGQKWPESGNSGDESRKDGCNFCTDCGYTGSCG